MAPSLRIKRPYLLSPQMKIEESSAVLASPRDTHVSDNTVMVSGWIPRSANRNSLMHPLIESPSEDKPQAIRTMKHQSVAVGQECRETFRTIRSSFVVSFIGRERANAAHQWRGTHDVRHGTEAESPRP